MESHCLWMLEHGQNMYASTTGMKDVLTLHVGVVDGYLQSLPPEVSLHRDQLGLRLPAQGRKLLA